MLDPQNSKVNQLFVPYSEVLLETVGTALGQLVPFQLEYSCVRLLDGTYEFITSRNTPLSTPDLQSDGRVGQAA